VKFGNATSREDKMLIVGRAMRYIYPHAWLSHLKSVLMRKVMWFMFYFLMVIRVVVLWLLFFALG